MKHRYEESGFSLIELLTVIGTIGILAAIMTSGFSVYRASAAYAVASSAFHSARNALEVSLSDADNLPSPVGLETTSGPGGVAAPLRGILPGMQLPKQTKISMSYDPACITDSCTESQITVKHCQAREYVTWSRFGDGVEMLLQHVSGAGC